MAHRLCSRSVHQSISRSVHPSIRPSVHHSTLAWRMDSVAGALSAGAAPRQLSPKKAPSPERSNPRGSCQAGLERRERKERDAWRIKPTGQLSHRGSPRQEQSGTEQSSCERGLTGAHDEAERRKQARLEWPVASLAREGAGLKLAESAVREGRVRV